MDNFKHGDVVKVNQICGLGVPLPAVGVVEVKTSNNPGWYNIYIKWIEHINEPCPVCRTTLYRKEERARMCSVRDDWMQICDSALEASDGVLNTAQQLTKAISMIPPFPKPPLKLSAYQV